MSNKRSVPRDSAEGSERFNESSSIKSGSDTESSATMLKKRKFNDCVPEYNDKKADVILVSSDGWEFRVQSYVLKSASTVLRAKLPRLVRGEEVIKVVYDELEDRRTVFGFLDLNPAHKLFEYSDKVRAIHTSRLVRLLRMLYKYDCQGFLAFLRQQISILLSRNGLDGPRLFCAASQPNYAVLMIAVVKHKGPKEFKFPVGVDKKSPLDLKEGVPPASVMDIASMPISFFKPLIRSTAWRFLKPTQSRCVPLEKQRVTGRQSQKLPT